MHRSYPVLDWMIFGVLAGIVSLAAVRWLPTSGEPPQNQARWQAHILAKTLAHTAVQSKVLDTVGAQTWLNRAQQSVQAPFVPFQAMIIAEQKSGMFAFLRKKKYVVHSQPSLRNQALGKESATDKQIYDLTQELQNKSRNQPHVVLQHWDEKSQTYWVATSALLEGRYAAAAIVSLQLPKAAGKDAQSSSFVLFFSWLLAFLLVGGVLFFVRGSVRHFVIVLGLASVALYPYVASIDIIQKHRNRPWEQRKQWLNRVWQQTPGVDVGTYQKLLPTRDGVMVTTAPQEQPLLWKTRKQGGFEIQVAYVQLAAQPIVLPTWPFLMLGGLALLFYGLLVLGGGQRLYDGFRTYGHAYAYITPAMLGMTVLVFVPFVVGIGLSFFQHQGGGRYVFVGLQNFKEILYVPWSKITNPLSFYFTLGVTILWTFLNVLLHVSIGLALALLLKNPLLRMKAVYRVLLILPWAIPNYITALIWKGMFHKQFGAINALLGWFGVPNVAWFSSFATAFCANLTTNTWLGFPFMMVVSLGALQSIPSDLYEAADVDGASRWQKFIYITLPLLKPALFPAIILGSIWTFNMFNIIYLVSGGAPDGATDILITEAYRWAFQRGDRFGYAAAYSVIIFIILLGYSLTTQKLTRATEGIYQQK